MKYHTYVITGANSFLGEAFVKILSEKKYNVIAVSRSPISEKLADVYYLEGINLLNKSDLGALKQHLNDFDKPFNVINPIGYFPGFNSIEEETLSSSSKVFDSNITALYNVAHSLLPIMVHNGSGHFVGFSSHTVYQHFPKNIAFTAAKAAVDSLIKGIANEYCQYNIYSNCFALATLLTDAEKELKPNGDFEGWLKVEDVCSTILSILETKQGIINGNTIHLYKYSNSYFGQSYYDRIKK